ncbi:MAG TPA: adenylate/guanylate cyclase domain-containing protein [Candidatus Limnocylindrales bacterium]|nr:adenylate/guanylate cyclase domain-containing protein [Candidatus Limnocylindrales bacterium]
MPANRHPILKTMLLAVSSFVIALILYLSHVLSSFELKAFDQFSRYLNPIKSSAPIVLVQIDQPSIDALSKQGITWPWPRQMYAPIVEYLSEADAIFLDMFFTEPSSYGQEDDILFAEAIKKAGNVYLPIFLSQQERPLTAEEEAFILRIAIPDKVFTALSYHSVITPIDDLKTAVHGAGNVMIKPDEDGVYRRVPLLFQLNQYLIPHFVLGYLIEKGKIQIRQQAPIQSPILSVQDESLPIQNEKLILRFYRDKDPFETFSAIQVLQWYLDYQASKPPAMEKGYFKDKIVLIGSTAVGLYDLKPTATSSVSTGIHIHATTLDNILRRNFIKPVNPLFVVAAMFLVCLFISSAVLRTYALSVNLSVFFVSLFLILLGLAVLFKVTIYMEVMPILTSLGISFILVTAYSYATEGKQRFFYRKTFLQYMDRTVADYLLNNPDLIRPGGQLRRVTVFFADIAGFTTISEIMPSDKLAVQLHKVLNALTEVIIENHGVIDKYMGDCVMAFWGAPVTTHRDEINACTAAIECLEILDEINPSFRAEGLPEISFRIGLHSGDATAGNIGSDRLFNYTVIGDTVNLASRLESANKFFGTKILISEDTYKKTEGLFFVRELGLIEVKGKTVPVKVFELIGKEENISPDQRQKVLDFHRGLTFYKDQKWYEAWEVFNHILRKYPEDVPAEYYKKQCEKYVNAKLPLTEDWNIIKMTEK